MQNRTAVVLFNLGGPDSLDAVEPFLFNLFADPDIFRLPLARFTQKPRMLEDAILSSPAANSSSMSPALR